MFVDNLTDSMTVSWLWQLFPHEGKVVDVFVSRKERRSCSSPFAFVRFAKLNEAQEAIKNMNDMVIRGNKIEVSMAEYKR